MIIAKPTLLIVLFFNVVVNLKAQVGEKFYGKASYYADKFHGRRTSSGEVYYREAYTAAHRNLPFNTIVEVVNTTNNRTAVVKINDRGPFAYNRMIDLSFAAAKDLELLITGDAKVEMRILSMDKSEYSIASYHSGVKGEFNREFKQYEPVIISGKNATKTSLDTNLLPQNFSTISFQLKPLSETFEEVGAISKQQAASKRGGASQPQESWVQKDGDQRHRDDLPIGTLPDPQEAFPVAPSINQFEVGESRFPSPKSNLKQKNINKKIPETVSVNQPLTQTEQSDKENQVLGFHQHEYLRIYKDSDGRIRIDTTKKGIARLAKNMTKQSEKSDDRPQTINSDLINSINQKSAVGAPKMEATKSKELYKNGFRQHSYVTVYQDKDGKIKLDTTSFERRK